MYCQTLDKELQLDEVGAKAFNLSRMLCNGYPVPPGIVIKKQAFDAYLESKSTVSDQLKKELASFVDFSGSKRYMVRSSALGEDANDHSFAGQLNSYISDGNMEALMDNIANCWNAYDNDRVRAYQKHTGKKLGGMGIVVQELIDPDYAGVLFTQSVLQEDFMLTEYVEGHGEKLVSGEITPYNFHCNRRNGSVDSRLPFSFLEAYKTGLELEELFGSPQDIEWVIRDNKFYVVQSRPITTKAFGKRIYWSNTNVNENYPDPISPLLYSIARSSYYHYFKNLAGLFQVNQKKIQELEGSFSNVIGCFGCHMYYNMSSIHEVLSASPFASSLSRSFGNFVGYQGKDQTRNEKHSFFYKIRFVKDFIQQNRSLEANVRSFEERVGSFNAKYSGNMELPTLRDAFHDFIEIRMHSWYKASLSDFFAMAYHGILGSFCKKYYPDSYEGFRNQLIQAIPDLISSKPIVDMWILGQKIKGNADAFKLFNSQSPELFWENIKDQKFQVVYSAIQEYLNKWGFRCSGELMLTQPNYIDQPQVFIQLLQQYMHTNPRDPAQLIREKYMEREGLLKRFRKERWKKRGIVFPMAFVEIVVMHLLVNLCSKGIASRERARLKQALLYYRFRTVVDKIGFVFKQRDWIENERDVFFMKYQEIVDQLDASDMLPAQLKVLISERKKQFEITSTLQYPDDFSTLFGDYARPEDVRMETSTIGIENDGIKGMTACGGRIQGTVRVLRSVMEAEKLMKGDILVTRQTDPGWAGVFPLIGGLIVERGGMLSHGSIVAREFGIPAIVGVDKATSLLKDGDVVLLDADKGKVFIL